MVYIKSKREIELMKEACKIANLAQKAVEKAIKPGITTYELDQIAEKTIREKALNPLPKANKLISLFAKTVTQVELSSGELLYFELISIKEFEKIVKELKNGSI